MAASRLESCCSALEDLEWLESVLVGKAKEPPSILADGGFIRAVLRTARSLRRTMRAGLESKGVREALKRSTSINWRAVSDATRDVALNAMEALMKGLPSAVMPQLKGVLDESGRVVVGETHKATSKKHKEFTVDATFVAKNERAIEALRDSTSIFFAPEYERRGTRFRKRAQAVLAKGLELGSGSREIGLELQREFNETGIARTYWDTVAANHVNRARNFSAVATYSEAGVERYEVVAIMDSRTTEICQMMDGQILSVERALDSFESFEDATDLNEVKLEVAPFMRREGDKILTAGGSRIATRTEGGWNRVQPSSMSARGINAPPYHHRCRSTIVPVFD